MHKNPIIRCEFFSCNILDIVNWPDENTNFTRLSKLQKMLKYGVNSSTQIIICDRIVHDRVISSIITFLIGPQSNFYKLKKQIKIHQKNIFNTLNNYPTLFNEKIKQLID